MPMLGLPRIIGTFTPQLMLRVFINAGYSPADLEYMRSSISKARDILSQYKIGVAIIPPGGLNSHEDIGTFSYNGPLFVDTSNGDGRPATVDSGAVTARMEVEPKMTGGARDTAVVLFGPSASSSSRGRVNFNSRFPYFCSVDTKRKSSIVTMLHEVCHCADIQHYMAQENLTGPQDDLNIMAEVTDAKANLRNRLNNIELDLLRRSYFFKNLD